MSETKYITVHSKDADGEEEFISIECNEQEVDKVIKSIVNKACLVVDFCGYGEYEAMYKDRLSKVKDNMEHPVDYGFAGIIYDLVVTVDSEPQFSPSTNIEDGLYTWDNWCLRGCGYDPDTDPFDITEVLPVLGYEMYDDGTMNDSAMCEPNSQE